MKRIFVVSMVIDIPEGMDDATMQVMTECAVKDKLNSHKIPFHSVSSFSGGPYLPPNPTNTSLTKAPNLPTL